MSVIIKALISLIFAGVGVYVLMHADKFAKGCQNYYVRRAERVQSAKGFGHYLAYLPVNNPETWKTSFATFMFKFGIIFLGIWLIIIAYPIMFGPITF